MTSTVQYLNLTLQVFFIDLLLSGDNAVVIALACRSLPERQRRQAMLAGTGIAILLRVLLTLIAGAVLQVPLLKLMGGIALTMIAIRLTLGDPDDGDDDPGSRHMGVGPLDLPSVIATVVVADLVMSADNVVALAAIAKGSFAVLALGLLLSVPLLMFGSWHITALLQRFPVLIRLGGAMLGWCAGDIAAADPLYAGWVSQQSPALSVVVPMLVAAYVLLQSRIIEQMRSSAAILRPVRKPGLPVSPIARESNADQPKHALGPAVTAVEAAGRSLRSPSAKTLRRLAMGGGWIVAIGAAYGLVSHHWMPVAGDLVHYDCPSKDVSLDYRPGGQKFRMSIGTTSVNGIVNYDNQIDWGDYHSASTTLGFVPPTRVLFGNSRSVRIDGGMFEDVTCNAR